MAFIANSPTLDDKRNFRFCTVLHPLFSLLTVHHLSIGKRIGSVFNIQSLEESNNPGF